ncbi:beta-lactamase superfamily domain-containing protein [Podospora fimiseda]|uniref:Beta-lactamase superfamily domain-containing protein n=1 Tax=Podospora fimiseda TaxID=252190 RepID=A0AAN7BK94_9PEZI|nr:beta-lactamase superfamily domain-containing protein [Podospora fimiseda]
MLPLIKIPKEKTQSSSPPSHHVYVNTPDPSSWSSYLPTSWLTSSTPPPPPSAPSSSTPTSFRNPWPSWHKPTKQEIWASFAWGTDDDPSIALALSHLHSFPPPATGSQQPNFDLTTKESPGYQAAQSLRIQSPDFSFPQDDSAKAKATWLGHASVLLQIPLPTQKRPFRCLFDPIFSSRASPTPYVGPIRSYPPPCQIADLPEDGIDAVIISHNHYDHMDEFSLTLLWERYKQKGIRFFVGLGNGKTLKGFGIDEDRIVEMDWWDGVKLGEEIKVWCVPAQHNSSRVGMRKDEALWCGWVVETERGEGVKTKVFFAGDTGYQFHGDPKWPPVRDEEEETKEEQYLPCPAFREVRYKFGGMDLLILPVSVGATFAYLKSFVPLPDSVSPFPRHSSGVMGANHMPPWDAVRVLREMIEGKEGKTVAMGIHWGTFVTDPNEVIKTLGQLEYACQRQGVRFGRGVEKGEGTDGKSLFVVVNHGESICI